MSRLRAAHKSRSGMGPPPSIIARPLPSPRRPPRPQPPAAFTASRSVSLLPTLVCVCVCVCDRSPYRSLLFAVSLALCLHVHITRRIMWVPLAHRATPGVTLRASCPQAMVRQKALCPPARGTLVIAMCNQARMATVLPRTPTRCTRAYAAVSVIRFPRRTPPFSPFSSSFSSSSSSSSSASSSSATRRDGLVS